VFIKGNSHDSWFPKFRIFVVCGERGREKLVIDDMVGCIADYFSQDNLLVISFAAMFG
jgi:hypothetical protein